MPKNAAFKLYEAATEVIRHRMEEIRRARIRRASIRELDAMSDSRLLDIGVDRADIPRVVEHILNTGKRPE